MILPDYSGLDPLRFVADALALLPDPAEASVCDLQVLASTSLGLHKLTVEIGAAIASADYKVRSGMRVADLAGEIAQLEALRQRGEVARRRLRSYTRAAAVANGLDPVTGQPLHAFDQLLADKGWQFSS